MIFIFTSDFTMNIKLFVVEEVNGIVSGGGSPSLIFDNINSVNQIVDNIDAENPSKIIFRGHHNTFKELANYYKGINKEVQILWQ